MKKVLNLLLVMLMMMSIGITAQAADLPDYTIRVDGDTAYVTVVDDFFGDVILASYSAENAVVDAKIFPAQILTDTKTHEYSIADLDRTGASFIKMFMWESMQPTEMFDENEGDWNTFSVDAGGNVTAKIKIEDDITNATFTLTAQTGGQLAIANSVVEDGYYIVTGTIPNYAGVSGHYCMNITKSSKVARKYFLEYEKAPTVAYAQKLIANIEAKADMLDVLLEKCANEGISTDYETMYVSVIRNAIPNAEAYTESGDYKMFFYTYDSCMRIYDEAKDNLKAYLEGEKAPFDVPKYVTSTITNDGTTYYADTVTSDGTEERRPVYLVGYNYLRENKDLIPEFAKLGVNHVQRETGPSAFIFEAVKWEPEISATTITAERSTTRKKSGSYSYRIKNTAQTGSVTLKQTVVVKPGKTYYFGLSAYGSGVTSAKFTFNGITVSIPNSTKFRFMDFSGMTEVADATLATKEIDFTIEVTGKIGDLFLDDIYVREGSTTGENAVINGGFEEENPDKIYRVDTTAIAQFVRELEEAAEHNIAVDVLLSPHYIPGFIVDNYPEVAYGQQTGGGNPGWYFGSIDYSAPILYEITEAYLDAFLPAIAECEAVKTICLMNEPNINLSMVKEKHTPLFQAFLKEEYGTIAALNAAYGGTSYGDFTEIEMPNQSESDYSVLYYDYIKYNRTVFEDFHQFLHDKVKEHLPNVPTHTKMMSTLDDWEMRGSWNHGTDHEIYAKITDYNGNDKWMTPSTLYTWGNGMRKAVFYDYQVGIKDAPVINSEDHILEDYDVDMRENSRKINETDIWQNAFHGRAQSALWAWAGAGGNAASILYGGLGARPDWAASIGKTNYDLNRLSWEIEAVKKAPKETAVLYSDTTRAFCSSHGSRMYAAYEALHFRGYRTGVITDNNLKNIDESVKVLVLPEIRNVREDVIEELLELANKGVKIVFLGTDVLKYNEYNQPHTTEKLTELKKLAISLSYTNKATLRNDLAEIADSVCTQVLRAYDAETGEEVSVGEYFCGMYEDDIIISMANFDATFTESPTVEIYLNDVKLTNMTELRSGNYVGDSITVEPFKPVLIRATK